MLYIGIFGGVAPGIRRSRVHDSKADGLYIFENGKGTLEDNDIFGNTLPGVVIVKGADPILRRNRILTLISIVLRMTASFPTGKLEFGV